MDVVDAGPRSVDLSRRRARATRSITRLGLAVGLVLVGVSVLLGASGDLLSLLLGALSGALVAGASILLGRWLESLDRRAVVHLVASERGIEAELREGRTVRLAWSDPGLRLSARAEPLFAPSLMATVRLPGVTGLVPGFLVDAARWDRLVTLARESGTVVGGSDAVEGRARVVQGGRGG